MRRGRRGLLATGLAGLVAACSPVSVLNGLAPRRRVASDIAYGREARQRLDVYVPPSGGRGAPVLMFIYGGSWSDGSKSLYPFVAGPLAEAGFVTIVPDYRLYPDVRYPAFLEDCAAALAWTRANAARFGGDPERLFLLGHSAGAYNAMMLCVDPQWLAPHGLRADRILRAAVGIAGPYDFLPLGSDMLRGVFSPAAADLPATQPARIVRAPTPPILLLHGLADRTVLPRNSEQMAKALREAGQSVQARYYPELGHKGIIAAMARGLNFMAPTSADTLAFLREHGA